ncbi:MAG: quinone-interacting membrane-bound oxidoreductase complex subunit QmoC [Deltaproteobacteria bacterium]|jgi:quinone-modifying oxidoreductase subunit QmoC|nr:quinone-interacting membrane-bound oxidoreductase complex subunit QmoC [Deltaproteobacteria bacterium]
MAQCTQVRPDLDFVREIRDAGGESLKKCYQCATCAVACPLSPANNPYPRKEMVWASWGLKDKLMNDVDLWLCHNCGNCADLCPRGARPADLMAAARNMVYKDLTSPSIIGGWMSSIKGLPFLVAIPALIWLCVWAARAGVKGSWFPRAADGRIVFGEIFYGDYTIDPIFILTFFGSLYILYRGTRKLLERFKPEGGILMLGSVKPVYRHVWDVLTEEILTHKKFQDCNTGKSDRKLGHMAVFYSFAILAVVTGIVAGGHWGAVLIHPALDVPTPMPLTFPVKIMANIGAVGLLFGLAALTLRRLKLDPKFQASSFYDWYLLGVIWVVALTGLLAQIFRLMDCVTWAFSVYYLHLVAVWMLFAYLPWSKLGHFVYRVAALTYVRAIGRR